MPGRVYPLEAPRTHHASEVAVYEALRDQLPDDWVAWHSLSLRTESGRFGEGDFVIASPQWGLLVLEVKGGQVRERGGHWYQGQKRLMPGPLGQAKAFRAKLMDEVGRVYTDFQVPSAVAVCLPHVAADNRPDNSDYRELLIDKSQLGELVPRLQAAFEAQCTRGNAPPGHAWIDAVTQLWGETWEPRIGLMGQARLAQAELEGLNGLQQAVLEGLIDNQNVLITGAAGTGKTTVASRLAMNLAWEGKSVRYLCFTEALAFWLKRRFKAEFGDYPVNIKAVAVRARAQQLAKRWGLEFEARPGTSAYWAELMDKVVEELEDRTTERPEVIIVDEAQCFDEADWRIVEHLRTLLGSVWIFQDPNQSFWQGRQLPESVAKGGFAKFRLPRQERMPPSIEALAFAYLEHGNPDEVIRRYEPSLIKVVDCEADPRKALAAELDDLIEMGFRPQQIAVATLCGMSASRLWDTPSVGEHDIVRATDERADERVVLDTFFRLQGLDREVVIVCEGHEDAAMYNYDTRMHQAVTRATAGVIILAGPGAYERDRVLRALRDAGKLDG
jgi:thymidine kinase